MIIPNILMASNGDRLQEITRKLGIIIEHTERNKQHTVYCLLYPYGTTRVDSMILTFRDPDLTWYKKLQKRQKTIEEQAQLTKQTSEKQTSRKASIRKTFGDSQREKKRDNAFAEVKYSVDFKRSKNWQPL